MNVLHPCAFGISSSLFAGFVSSSRQLAAEAVTDLSSGMTGLILAVAINVTVHASPRAPLLRPFRATDTWTCRGI